MKFQLGDRVRVASLIRGALPRSGVVAGVRDGRMTIAMDDGSEYSGPDDDTAHVTYMGPAPDPAIVKAVTVRIVPELATRREAS